MHSAFALLVVAVSALQSCYVADAGQTRSLRRLAEEESEKNEEIPHIIYFTHPTNLLSEENLDPSLVPYRDNVLKTVQKYREAWSEPDADVFFLDDEACFKGINDLFPTLATYFKSETSGRRKADLCKLVALYHSGGYYFDTDVKVVEKYRPRDEHYFAGVSGCDGRCMKPYFIAASPKNLIVEASIKLMEKKYKHGLETDLRPLGTTLMEVYNFFLSEKDKKRVFLLDRLELDYDANRLVDFQPKLYPHVVRQPGVGECNVVSHDKNTESIYFFERFIGSAGCSIGVIPNKIWFTHETNILETKMPDNIYENILRTIKVYRQFWNKPEAPVTFLDDTACAEMIKKAKSDLLPYFAQESSGEIKGAICRNAAVYLYGGYYFDVDLKVVERVNPGDASFVSTLACGGGCFFNAFFAATPQHPIVNGALQKMLQTYKDGEDTSMLGPVTMANAYNELQIQEKQTDVILYEELRLDEDGPDYTHYPHVKRQNGSGNCNIVVHDPARETIFFFASFVGYGECEAPQVTTQAEENS